MPIDLTQLDHLGLLVQRLLDAEVLSEAQGTALLQESQAARQVLEAGAVEDAQWHVQQLARRLETLLGSQALAPAEAAAVLQSAHHLLNPETEAGA